MARARSKVSEQQRTYVDAVMTGKTKSAAAKLAGYDHAQGLEASETVRRELAIAREQLTDITKITRVTVVEGMLDGIALARMQGDSGNVIKGWAEVGKLLGHYAPEVKTINVTANQQRLRSKFEALSDEELVALQNGAIDVESREVE